MRIFLIHSGLSFLIAYQFFKLTDLLPYNAVTASGVFILFFMTLWLSSALYSRSYFRKIPIAIEFIIFFLKEVVVANLRIAYDIITPSYLMKPAVIALPLDVKTDLEITLLSCIISLTPGSLTLDVREDKQVMYLHTLYAEHDNLDKIKHTIKDGFERRILELTT
ncbi:cation:proton antiporter [Pontibacter qinzhouensis]|uniref:Cation:proton antiporter n=1 Tax=Pontibacter qinzhouensis TaxID=2603253 RepID=A0A5C8KD26_9BACT|nr:Na+/H+ antiporter subunit E [Pontibacter qinzhouensis]TXK51932.1 cation:proton antiporter [Pontibacter qinzhouensis]